MRKLTAVIEKNLSETTKRGGEVRVTSSRRGNRNVVITATVGEDGQVDGSLSPADAVWTHQLKVTETKKGLRVDRSRGVAQTDERHISDERAAELAAAIFRVAGPSVDGVLAHEYDGEYEGELCLRCGREPEHPAHEEQV